MLRVIRFPLTKPARLLALVPALLLLTGCAGMQKAPGCSGGAYRSLNPAHYPTVQDNSRADASAFTSNT
jgi:hypothetical protein